MVTLEEILNLSDEQVDTLAVTIGRTQSAYPDRETLCRVIADTINPEQLKEVQGQKTEEKAAE